MKLKKWIKYSLAMTLVFGTATVLTGCGNDNSSANAEKAKQYEIYKLAKEAGATDLTYEEWLVAIKGEKGDTGATGQAGADGATWHVGADEPASTLGKEGDLYLETDTSDVWKKGTTGWTVISNIKGQIGTTGATGQDGATGKDGTKWLTGEGSPTGTANEGDFYFDKKGNNIWTYKEGWILEVDLEDDVVSLTLEDGKEYTGTIMDKEFTVVLETENNIQNVVELYINGVVDGENQPINCYQMVKEYKIENDVIVLTIDISNFTQIADDTSTQYLVLDENNDSLLVTYVSDEDKEMIKGTYTSSIGYLTVTSSNILYYDGNARIKGNYDVVSVDDGRYALNITTENGKRFEAYLDAYSKYFNIKIEDFSGTYTLEEDSFVYDDVNGTVTFEGSESINVTKYLYVYDATKAVISFEYSFEEEPETIICEIDYLSGTVTDATGFAGIIPFMGSGIVYGEETPERYYIINQDGFLEEVYDGTVVYSNNDIEVRLDLFNLSYTISTRSSVYQYNGNIEDLFYLDPIDGTITVADGDTVIQLTFSYDMTLNDINIIGAEFAFVTNEEALRSAVENGSAKITLENNITLTSPLSITNDVMIDGNNHTISASNELEALIEPDTSEVYTLFYIAEDVTIEFNNVTLDGNQAGRAITAVNGHVVFNNTNVNNGIKRGVYRSGGVFIGYSASFTMNSGVISGNGSSVDGEPITVDNYYLYYSADLWIGSNVVGSVISIGQDAYVGRVFVNANEYSATNQGSFILMGGEIQTLYLEYDKGYGAIFNYESGHVSQLIVSTTTSGTSHAPYVGELVAGTYQGGVDPNLGRE